MTNEIWSFEQPPAFAQGPAVPHLWHGMSPPLVNELRATQIALPSLAQAPVSKIQTLPCLFLLGRYMHL